MTFTGPSVTSFWRGVSVGGGWVQGACSALRVLVVRGTDSQRSHHSRLSEWWGLILPCSHPLKNTHQITLLFLFFFPPLCHCSSSCPPNNDREVKEGLMRTEINPHTHTHVAQTNSLKRKIHGKQGVKLNGCPSGLYLPSLSVLLSILTLFSFYFWRSSQIWVFFAMIDWVLAFVFFNMSSPAHFTIPAVHSLTLFACVCSRRWASVNTVTQKEATQRRHAKFTQLLTQNDEVRHWFQDAPSSLQKEREGETGRMVLGWWE